MRVFCWSGTFFLYCLQTATSKKVASSKYPILVVHFKDRELESSRASILMGNVFIFIISKIIPINFKLFFNFCKPLPLLSLTPAFPLTNDAHLCFLSSLWISTPLIRDNNTRITPISKLIKLPPLANKYKPKQACAKGKIYFLNFIDTPQSFLQINE